MRTRTLVVGAVAGAFAATAVAGPAAAKLVKNGGFEEPATTSYSYIREGTTFAGWRVTGPDGASVSIVNEKYTLSGVELPAHTGRQFINLAGWDTSDAGRHGIEKVARTKAGKRYRLTYAVGNFTASSYCGPSTKVDVYVRGRKVHTASNRRGTDKLTWLSFGTTFKATGRDTRIAFVNADGPSDGCSALDSVKLRKL